jgi:hypothetical protein
MSTFASKRLLFVVVAVILLVSISPAQITVYNNFGPEHGGWDYNYGLGWTVAGENVPAQYGVEQAMGFQSTANGTVSDIWVAFFYVPLDTVSDQVTIRLTSNPQWLPPDTANVMEEWVITEFESWSQWDPPHHLQGSGATQLEDGMNYWLWAVAEEETWCGWCMNIDPVLTCAHTMRREGENWLPIAYETASAFRVDITATPVTVTLTPASFPVQIPSFGGTFDFNVAIANIGISPETFDFWTMVTLPNSTEYGPIILVSDFTAPAGWTGDRDRTQVVPGSAPAGMYTYDAYVGVYPDEVWTEDHFDFEKLTDGEGSSLFTGWACWGEEFDESAAASPTLPVEYSLFSAYPNPFNPSTIISYQLPEISYVNLTVYDAVGRQVAALVNGWREPGIHEVTFDASSLTSGVYFVRLSAGDFQQTQKLLLVK